MAALNVLIIDDEPGDRTLERLALGEQAFECSLSEADSPETALEKLGEIGDNLDVVLLDGHLGGKDATFVIDHMKRSAALRRARIVIITGSGDSAEHRAYLEHGADLVMEKQADLNVLIDALAVLGHYARAG